MVFYKYRDAVYHRNSQPFPHKHRVVRDRHWSVDLWDWVPCWTVVYDA